MDGKSESKSTGLVTALFSFLSTSVAAVLLASTVTDLDFFIDSYRRVDFLVFTPWAPVSIVFPIVSVAVAAAQANLTLRFLRSTPSTTGALLAIATTAAGLAVQLLLISLFVKGQFGTPLTIMRYAAVISMSVLFLGTLFTQSPLRWLTAFVVSPALALGAASYAFGVARTPVEAGIYDPRVSADFSVGDPLRGVSEALFYGRFAGRTRTSPFSGTISLGTIRKEEIIAALASNAHNLNGRSFVGLDAPNAPFGGQSFQLSDLTGASLDGADLRDAQFYRATLRHVVLTAATARGANFSFADLTDAVSLVADLSFANLVYAKAPLAEFRGAKLNFAALIDTDLSAVSLNGADLRGATLQGARLWGADLEGVKWGATSLVQADLWRAWPVPAQGIDGPLAAAWPSDVFFRRANIEPENFTSNAKYDRAVEALLDQAQMFKLLAMRRESQGNFDAALSLMKNFSLDERLNHSMAYDVTAETDQARAQAYEDRRFSTLWRTWRAFAARTSQKAYYASLGKMFETASCGSGRATDVAAIRLLLARLSWEEQAWNDTLGDTSDAQAAEYIAYYTWKIDVMRRMTSEACLGPNLDTRLRQAFETHIASATAQIDLVNRHMQGQRQGALQ